MVLVHAPRYVTRAACAAILVVALVILGLAHSPSRQIIIGWAVTWASPPPSPFYAGEIRGINYGGRFIPERWLRLPGYGELYAGAFSTCASGRCDVSLCDVAVTAPDAGKRMLRFLDSAIRPEHFEQIARNGFNLVRLQVFVGEGAWFLLPRDRAVTQFYFQFTLHPDSDPETPRGGN